MASSIQTDKHIEERIVAAGLDTALRQLSRSITRDRELLPTIFNVGDSIDRFWDLLTAWTQMQDLPPIRVVDGKDINGARGAFAAATGEIYLSREWLLANGDKADVLAGVILEELGHYADTRLSSRDSAGDEGAIFAAVVGGMGFSSQQLAAWQAEDDRGFATIDGKSVAVEFSGQYGTIKVDGAIGDWQATERLATAADGTGSYSIYGKYTPTDLVFAIDSAVAIGTNTTIWLNTDGNRTTGTQVFNFALGAEARLEVGSDGKPQLLFGNTTIFTLDSALSADRTKMEVAIPLSVLSALNKPYIELVADVNDTFFNLPANYSLPLRLATLPSKFGSLTIDGELSDWQATDRIDFLQGTGVAGYQTYGKKTDDGYVIAIKSDTRVIGGNTTFWLNTDGDQNTGYQLFGTPGLGGAEYHVNITSDGRAKLYQGTPGQPEIAELDFVTSVDGKTIELGIKNSLIPVSAASKVDTWIDINDVDFLPGFYTQKNKYTIDNGFVSKDKFGDITLDANLAEWQAGDRVDFIAGSSLADYKVYGKKTADGFVLALDSATKQIGADTTFWFNTDDNRNTGHQIFGVAGIGGAEYNINFDSTGTPYLYSGSEGDKFISRLDYKKSADGTKLEIAVKKDLFAGDPGKIETWIDVNNQDYLPVDYSRFSYTIDSTGFVPRAQYGNITLNGQIDDWKEIERLDYLANTGLNGFKTYGKVTTEGYVFAIQTSLDNVTIGQGSTLWLNTDDNNNTGVGIFGQAGLGGADYNIYLDENGTPFLYNGPAGNQFVSRLDFAKSADGKTLEVAVPKNLIAGTPSKIDTWIDVNDTYFLPGDYSTSKYTIDDRVLTPRSDLSKKVGIVYSETTADRFFDKKAYSHLVMNAQNQAMMAGVPFDLLTEADLKDINKIAQYDALVFPSFNNVKQADLTQIEENLFTASYKYGIGTIAVGDFMVANENGVAFSGDSTIRMKKLFDLKAANTGSGTGKVLVRANDTNGDILQGYTANETIANYQTDIPYRTYEGVSTAATVIAEQDVNNQTFNSILATKTGGKNLHFSTDTVFADSNIAWQGLQWILSDDKAKFGLQMSRNQSITIARDDVDFSAIDDKQPVTGNAVTNVLTRWKNDYNFVGSHYINIGYDANVPVPPPGTETTVTTTNWAQMRPIYERWLALGNEIGSHSYTHPEFTSNLTPEQLKVEFDDSRKEINRQLGLNITGAAIPGNPESDFVDREVAKYYPYMTGVGSAYRNSFGYYAPDVKDANGKNLVFFAPNLSFDFNLFDFRGLSETQVDAAWQQEFAAIGKHANQAIYQPAYHDYLLAEDTIFSEAQQRDIPYKLAPFENLIKTAYQSGTEFVTHEDLQQRIRGFEKSQLFLDKIDANTYKAKVNADSVGKFAIDLNQGKIKSVTNWYAYDDDSVFLPKLGGEYTIELGDTPEKVSRIVELPMRAELLSVVGDGTNLAFSFQGTGKVILEANTPAGKIATVEGATSYRKLANNRIEVEFGIDRLNQGRLVFVDDRNPVVANPVANVTAIEDAAATTIDLTNVFSDPDLDIVAATIAANTNSNLVTTSITGNTLTLNYAKDGNGSADITLRGTANGKTVDTTFSVNITPVDDAPTIITPIPAVTVNEGSPRTTIDLANVFGDIDNPVANIVKTIQTNNNSNLVTANITGNTLTLDYSPTLTGTAEIDIRATSGGQTVDTRLNVTVNSVFTNLNGDDNANTLNGSSGRDRINGLGGNDTINGLDGDDYLIGGSGRDTLNGGNGNDILVGYDPTTGSISSDVDTLIGGGGADLFVVGDAGGVRYLNSTGAAYAVINDFNAAEGDKIQLKGSSTDYVNVFNSQFNNNYIYYRSTTATGNPRNDLVTVVVNNSTSLNLADTNIFQYV